MPAGHAIGRDQVKPGMWLASIDCDNGEIRTIVVTLFPSAVNPEHWHCEGLWGNIRLEHLLKRTSYCNAYWREATADEIKWYCQRVGHCLVPIETYS